MAKKTVSRKIDADYFEKENDTFTEELKQRAEAGDTIVTPNIAFPIVTLKKGAVDDLSEADTAQSDAVVEDSAGNEAVAQDPAKDVSDSIDSRHNMIIMYNIPTDLYLDFLTCLHNCRHLYRTQTEVFEHITSTFVKEIKPTLGAFFDNARIRGGW